ncbi:MAG TPA: FlgD immunoglobulin-like domain containing protein, partial [Candidatus Krumholzibacteria bacterium]|nr:FlgD immunoglobulin-like domain containing protein [Candidatus Krumholzibacteria bacterium]
GYSVGTADFGGGPLVSAGGEDVFVAKYSHAGAHVWSARFGDAQNDRALSVGVDAADQVMITGSFAEAINFGGGTFLANGGGDFFLAKFDQEDVVPVLITDFRARVSDDRVELRWRASSDENIASWVVNRWTGSGTRPDRVASGTWDALGSATDPKVEAGRTYRYELTVRTDAGDDYRSPTATVTIPASTNALGQNAPNPFNPSTRIEYSLAARARAVIAIHDSSGRLVRRLDGGVLPAGRHAAAWDGRDTLGRPVASGVYFYRLEGIPAAGAKRMVLLK